MSGKKVLAIAIFLIVLVIVLSFILGGKDEPEEVLPNTPVQDMPNVNITNTSEIKEISDTELQTELITSVNPVVVFCYTSWSEPCKEMAQILDDIVKAEQDITFVKVDIEKYPAMTSSYKVNSIPTIILFKNSVEKDRIEKLVNKQDILDFIAQ